MWDGRPARPKYFCKRYIIKTSVESKIRAGFTAHDRSTIPVSRKTSPSAVQLQPRAPKRNYNQTT
ncbi:MAG: hypothetical protein JGK26_23995 [Microcoleus sp. PH2017_27_LUM_O_A]|uniref:hypothetical protein n=1 Tax=unclassified Microcoleus TaxID=2642155 RepID=UPI001DF57AD3|nr:MULTISPECIES: hypothetical protein [unclassified Microcoleus]MCC3462709.1 hypothetical protein [Microcoleus sp. PH2017_11_PCY_U_A]MCC3562131.1 hypothetical protein [Microcoleus sp. PH2017_27_LUM_O_A]